MLSSTNLQRETMDGNINYKSVSITFLIGIVWTSYVSIKRNLMVWLLGTNVDLKTLNLDDFTIPIDFNNSPC